VMAIDAALQLEESLAPCAGVGEASSEVVVSAVSEGTPGCRSIRAGQYLPFSPGGRRPGACGSVVPHLLTSKIVGERFHFATGSPSARESLMP
jgi:hypothetical protein